MQTQELTAKSPSERVADLIPQDEWKPTSIEQVRGLPSFREKLIAYENDFGLPFSQLGLESQHTLILRRLQQMVNTVMLNPLWKDRLTNAGITEAPLNFEAWQEIPVSDLEMVRSFYMGDRPGMVVPMHEADFGVIATGGTATGNPDEAVYAARELQDTFAVAAAFLNRYVLPQFLSKHGPKWLITTLADYQMWSGRTLTGSVLQEIPDVNYIGAGPVGKDVFQHIMSYEGEKAVQGIAHGVSLLSGLAGDLDESVRKTLRLALYSSAPMPLRKQLGLKAVFPNISILSYFTAIQAEGIGIQLNENSPYLASIPGLHFVEIVDENGKWVEEGEEGELVITRLHAHEAPILRHKIGDRMIRRADLKGPGLQTQQFEYAGRSEDIIRLGDYHFFAPKVYRNLCHEFIKANCFDLASLSHEMQFVNHHTTKGLYLLAAVDDPWSITSRMRQVLGFNGLKGLFERALRQSLPTSEQSQFSSESLNRTGYHFDLKFVEPGSYEIIRSRLAKVPLMRDIF